MCKGGYTFCRQINYIEVAEAYGWCCATSTNIMTMEHTNAIYYAILRNNRYSRSRGLFQLSLSVRFQWPPLSCDVWHGLTSPLVFPSNPSRWNGAAYNLLGEHSELRVWRVGTQIVPQQPGNQQRQSGGASTLWQTCNGHPRAVWWPPERCGWLTMLTSTTFTYASLCLMISNSFLWVRDTFNTLKAMRFSVRCILTRMRPKRKLFVVVYLLKNLKMLIACSSLSMIKQYKSIVTHLAYGAQP